MFLGNVDDVYNTTDSFSCQHEKLSSTVRTATQVVHIHPTLYRSGWPVAFLAPTYLLPRLYCPNTSSHCKEEWQKHIRYVTIYLQDRRGVALLRYKNSAEITVLMCPQKLYPV